MPELDEVISFEEVCMAIKSMKPCKSPGVDRISTEVYKALPDHLVQLLTKIFKRNPCYRRISRKYINYVGYLKFRKYIIVQVFHVISPLLEQNQLSSM